MNQPIFCNIMQLKSAFLNGKANGMALKCLLISSLLVCSQALWAEKLYRWVEPDGSITFSPTPPASGVEYKQVDAIGNNLAQSEQIEQISRSTPSILATSEHDIQTDLPRVNETPLTARPAAAIARQKLSYAPSTGAAQNQSGITRSMAAPAAEPMVRVQNDHSNLQAISSAKKRRQCQDLSKRVLSLEQRLRSKLQPDDMDNTVVAMARYQRSFDQFCVN